jgi:hypothetical protein
MLDSEVYMQPNGSDVYVKSWMEPVVPDGTTCSGVACAGMACATQYYAANGNNNWDARNYGAPWTTSEIFSFNEYIQADPTEIGSNRWISDVVRYQCNATFSSYNVSNCSTVCTGSGKFGSISDGTQLFDVSRVRMNFSTAPADVNDNASREVISFYNSTVENWVRKYDTLRYFGVEEGAIVAYESENFQRSNLVVTDTGAGQVIDVSLNITNDTGVSQKFNALLCIMDYDIVSLTGMTTKYMFDGATVYPAVASNTTTWPYYGAIKTTATLSNGSTETVTWSNAYTLVSGHAYWIWCSGMIYGPWTAR